MQTNLINPVTGRPTLRPVPKPVRESEDLQTQLAAVKAAKAEVTQAGIALQIAKQKFDMTLNRLLENVDLDVAAFSQVVGDGTTDY